jgi:hypothetical protein
MTEQKRRSVSITGQEGQALEILAAAHDRSRSRELGIALRDYFALPANAEVLRDAGVRGER